MPLSRRALTRALSLSGLMLVSAAATVTPVSANAPLATQARRGGPVGVSMQPTGVATPADRERRLKEKDMRAGSRMLIRIFKAESELEVWLERDGTYERFATYPICYWSGTLGPKLREGDRQAPEGFYSVSGAQLHRHGRWPRALDIGYPNALDRANNRSGSAILVHGGCSSIGCYAMTNPVMEEIFTLSEAAIAEGQDTIPIHVFPFRMTDANVAAQQAHPWSGFWANLKQAYDLFERTRRPPHVSICGTRYLVRDGTTDSAEPVTPTRMVKFARMMQSRLPVQPGECSRDSTPTPEVIAAASRFANGLRNAEVPQHAVATLPIPPKPIRVFHNARANYAAARKARVAAYPRRMAVRTR